MTTGKSFDNRNMPVPSKPKRDHKDDADEAIDSVLFYAVQGFMSEVKTKMSYRDVYAKLHLYETVVTRTQPTSAIYMSINEAVRKSNLKFLKDLNSISLVESEFYERVKGDFRSDLEKRIFEALKEAPKKESLALWKHFLRIAEKSHLGVSPDPQMVRNIKDQLDDLHDHALKKLENLFAMFTVKVQRRLLRALGRNVSREDMKLDHYSQSWLSRTRQHLANLFNGGMKQDHIVEITKIRKNKLQHKLEEKLERNFVINYKAISKQHGVAPKEQTERTKPMPRKKLF